MIRRLPPPRGWHETVRGGPRRPAATQAAAVYEEVASSSVLDWPRATVP